MLLKEIITWLMTVRGEVISKLRRKKGVEDDVYVIRITPDKERTQTGLVQMSVERRR